ncbi:MAG: hypothetical protein AAB681_02285 [Patescibacteria group bacterium]
MNKLILQENKGLSAQTGFAMLFTVLIVSLILSITLSISNITFKQTILSSLAKDSQIAFYQADTAIECGMLYDTTLSFPVGTDPSSVVSPIFCGNDRFVIDTSQSSVDYLLFTQVVGAQTDPCSTILFDKKTNEIENEAIVQGLGYNTCTASARQVQRALQVTYSLAP